MPAGWSLQDVVDSYVEKSAKNVSSIGIEWERSGIYRDTGKPVPYVGTNGYLAILQKLTQEVGWEILEEEAGCGILELKRGNTRITIEGDGRLELSGSPQSSLHDLARELRLHNNEVLEIGNIFNIGWLPIGLQPLHSNEEIPLAPRERYRIFQRIKGHDDPDLSETMTKRCNGLTVNIGYKDAASAVRMAQCLFRITPIIGAVFASSPLELGKPAKYLDTRRYVNVSRIPGRTGIPESILDPEFSLEQWVAYYATIPVILTKRNHITKGVKRPVPFTDWMQKGMEGDVPTIEDFDVHVKTTWSDIRLRPAYLEYRVMDSVPFRIGMGAPALIKGLLLDPKNWDAIEAMTQDWTFDDVRAADKRAWSDGLKTKIKGKTILSYAQDLLRMANDSLHAFNVQNGAADDETALLATLKEHIHIKEESPAEEILRKWETEWNRSYVNLLAWCEEN